MSEQETTREAHMIDFNELVNDATKALHILRALASGVDPITGEIFPEDSPMQHPQVIRALFIAVRALENQPVQPQMAEQKSERILPQNAGKAWDAEQDALLCQQFDAGMNINDIMNAHGRTRGSITSRLVRLGKIERRDMADTVVQANSQT